jgi:hypothetical protein
LEETKGKVTKPVQVDVFGGLNAPVKPLDRKQNALPHAAYCRIRSKVKEKWEAKRHKVANEHSINDLPPRVPDDTYLGDRYQHPPWIRLLQQPAWKVKLEQEEALAVKENMVTAAQYVKEPPPAPVCLEERPPGPVIHKVIRNDSSEQRYLATVIGRTAAKKVMMARRDVSQGPTMSWHE